MEQINMRTENGDDGKELLDTQINEMQISKKNLCIN